MSEERRAPDGMAELDAELDRAQRLLERRVDPGRTAVWVACAVLVLIVSLVLPWTGDVLGWSVLAGTDWVGPLPRLFVFVLVGAGLLGSTLTLAVRWWALAWVCAAGCGIGVITGIWAIWSRQVGAPHGATGPGIGLVLAELSAFALAICWARIAVRRTP